MKFVRILALVSALLFLLYFTTSWSVPPCPHPKFIANHLCVHCTDLDSAAEFSKYRPRPSYRNSVFLGRPAFEQKTYLPDRCGNVNGVRVATCTLKDAVKNSYACQWLGTNCFGEHSIASGHLFYNDIKCF